MPVKKSNTKTETKKPSVRAKKPAQRASVKPAAADATAALAKELRSLIPRLDAEGLQFLIEQAQVHLYNMQVDELNRSLERGTLERSSKPGKKTAPNTKNSDELRIEGSESGSSFYMVYRGQWVMFSRDEIAQMLRIVSAPVTELERREYLFDWFVRERQDVFAAIPLADKFDERLKKILALLAKNFKLKR